MAEMQDDILHASDAGTAASQTPQPQQPFRVAPTTESKFNVLAQDLVPVACISLNDIAFEFDSSFVKPRVKDIEVAAILKLISTLRERHKTASGQMPLASVFGHADPTGAIEYNKTLSGRRAKAVYALLTHRSDLWMELYNNPFGGDDWKKAGVADTMRAHVGPGAPGVMDALIQAYMALLCPGKLEKTPATSRVPAACTAIRKKLRFFVAITINSIGGLADSIRSNSPQPGFLFGPLALINGCRKRPHPAWLGCAPGIGPGCVLGRAYRLGRSSFTQRRSGRPRARGPHALHRNLI